MNNSIPIPAYADLTQYDHIRSVRPTDGAEIRAQRVVVDEQTPVRWTIIAMDKLGKYLFIERIENGVRPTYSTIELVELAQKVGFGEWQQSSVAEMEAIALTPVGYREFLMHQFQIPDPTSYPKESAWVEVDYLHNKGLSDDTIPKLVQEDPSFRRVNSDRVEYDIGKVYGHPKVRDFMSKMNSDQATMISYEHILKDELPQ